MHIKRDYTRETTPAFQAVEDIKAWVGMMSWDEVSKIMTKAQCPACFARKAKAIGVTGYPVEAWYDLYQGQGAWRKEFPPARDRHKAHAFEQGKALASAEDFLSFGIALVAVPDDLLPWEEKSFKTGVEFGLAARERQVS